MTSWSSRTSVVMRHDQKKDGKPMPTNIHRSHTAASGAGRLPMGVPRIIWPTKMYHMMPATARKITQIHHWRRHWISRKIGVLAVSTGILRTFALDTAEDQEHD